MGSVRDGLLAIGVSLAIGIVCRLLKLPIPAPPSLIGVLMIASLAAGYAVAGLLR